jgi:hypothetical protein
MGTATAVRHFSNKSPSESFHFRAKDAIDRRYLGIYHHADMTEHPQIHSGDHVSPAVSILKYKIRADKYLNVHLLQHNYLMLNGVYVTCPCTAVCARSQPINQQVSQSASKHLSTRCHGQVWQMRRFRYICAVSAAGCRFARLFAGHDRVMTTCSISDLFISVHKSTHVLAYGFLAGQM